ncbi:C-GCAxxG-C-C family protein [Butyrivibrio sp. FCS014]|uniref:C-GCAxxG-C-C family protein n=1 Tax=Butyrivibrio sp. FCS014 TaxID=1408304 RepID=UPI00046512BA|nr:C-GCAxxG-C-C family protein [Butyrivibrio sp. FCS014]
MTIEKRADIAAELKATGQCNCTQSVLKVFEDKIDVAPEELSKLASGFAAGMGCMESTCGALIGAVMVAGMITDGKGTPRYSKDLVKKFNDKCGATICKDLKGITTGKVICECPDCVRNAVISLGEVVES